MKGCEIMSEWFKEMNDRAFEQAQRDYETEPDFIGEMVIDYDTFLTWKDQPILHDEDDWDGKYQTYGEMWKGEGYEIETE